jgi:hypothetical protein
MDGYAYSPPAVVKKPFFLQKQILIPGIFLILAVVVVVILASIFGGAGARKREAAETLYMRINGLSEVITEYQPHLRNSVVRSNVAALKTSLSNTYRDLGAALPVIGVDITSPTERVVNSEAAHMNQVEAIIEEGRLNVNLDQVFVREMAIEIALLISMTNELSVMNTDEALHATLSVFRSDLVALGRTFQNLAQNPNLRDLQN